MPGDEVSVLIGGGIPHQISDIPVLHQSGVVEILSIFDAN
jgi:hypothetical protein